MIHNQYSTWSTTVHIFCCKMDNQAWTTWLRFMPNWWTYSPRPVDLDVIFYEKHQTNGNMREHFFLASFDGSSRISWSLDQCKVDILSICWNVHFKLWKNLHGEPLFDHKRRPNNSVACGSRPHRHNLKPDIFSDRWKFLSGCCFSEVKLLASEHADTVGIGTRSTCHFATRLSEQEELQRLIPVLGAVVRDTWVRKKLIHEDNYMKKCRWNCKSRSIYSEWCISQVP